LYLYYCFYALVVVVKKERRQWKKSEQRFDRSVLELEFC
jgi:hypothetical protein